MKKLSYLFIATLAIAIILPISTMAASFEAGEHTLVSVPISDDMYAAGARVQIESPVEGDLYLAGGEVEVNSDVSEDLIIAGGRVFVKGNVGDDLRIFGGEINIMGKVTDDMIITGGNVNIFSGAEVGGDLIIAGGEVRQEANVAQNLVLNGGRMILNGNVGQGSEINGGELEINGELAGPVKIVADKVTVGPNASFLSPVEYWTKLGEVDFGEADATYNAELARKVSKSDNKGEGFGAGFMAIGFMSSVLILFLLQFARRKFRGIASEIKNNIWQSFGIGILYFIVTPIAAIILLITLIGFPLGMFMVMLYVFSLVFAAPLTAMALASLWEKRKDSHWNKWKFFGASLLSLIVFEIVTAIPLIGWLIGLFVVSSVFGAILIFKHRKK